MIFRLWGVRGSHTRPLTPEEIQKKISAVIQTATPGDMSTPESKKRFLKSLPPEIYGTIGGNTACMEIETSPESCIMVDAGTGLREWEHNCIKNNIMPNEYHIFLSHFHYDHLLGLPYFSPMYNSKASIHFYSPYPAMEHILKLFINPPYHPVPWRNLKADIHFHTLAKPNKLSIKNFTVEWIHRKHPNGAFSYKFSSKGKSLIYSSDTELTAQDFERTDKNIAYFHAANAIVMDAQYELDEAVEKYNWGHSSFKLAVEFAREFAIKKLLLFHHDPWRSDAKLYNMLQEARQINNSYKTSHSTTVDIDIACEGLELQL